MWQNSRGSCGIHYISIQTCYQWRQLSANRGSFCTVHVQKWKWHILCLTPVIKFQCDALYCIDLMCHRIEILFYYSEVERLFGSCNCVTVMMQSALYTVFVCIWYFQYKIFEWGKYFLFWKFSLKKNHGSCSEIISDKWEILKSWHVLLHLASDLKCKIHGGLDLFAQVLLGKMLGLYQLHLCS